MHKRARRRSFLILALFIVLGSLSSLTVMAEDPQYNLGLLPSNYDGPLYDMSGMGLLALPTSVDLSDGLPPIGDQRYQNSCVGWAVAYYYKTYQEAQERGWSLTDTSHQFSPSYVYNQRSTSDCGNDGGMTMWNGLNIIKQQGVAPLSSMPYTCRSGVPCEACTQPSQAQIDAAYPYRSDSFSALFSYQGGADINGLKTLLASGQPFLIAIPVYTSFYQVSYANPVVPVPAANESLAGGHAMFVVGYDDAKGGFLTANSWGSGWGWNGYCYLSYDFVQQKAWEGWIMTDHVESGVTPTPTATRTQTPQNTPEGPTATPTMTPTRSWPTATPVGPTATPSPEPPKPVVNSGQVFMDGYPAPADTSVEVYMHGGAVASAWTEMDQGASRYIVQIRGDDPCTQLVEGATEGDAYRLHVAGVENPMDYYWHAGQQSERDFFLTSASSHVLDTWIRSYGPSAGGWASFDVFPRLLGDVDGDGTADIAAFGNKATYVSLSTGSSFGSPTAWIYGYGPAAGGWSDFGTFPRRLADVDGDGKDDIVAFGNKATYVSLSTGTSFAPARAWVSGYGVAAGGWTDFDTFPRQLGDVNGDGMADIVAFGNKATYVSLSTGTSFGTIQAWVSGYGVAAGGWSSFDTFPRQLADVNGDGMADIVAFGNRATYVSLSQGTGFGGPVPWVYSYGPAAGGWSGYDVYPRVLADMNGDGMADIVAFGGNATYVSLSTGSSFGGPLAWTGAYGTNAGGWSDYDTFPRDAADVTGDGRADLVGFGGAGVYVDVTSWEIDVATLSSGDQQRAGETASQTAERIAAVAHDEPALRAIAASSGHDLPMRVAR